MAEWTIDLHGLIHEMHGYQQKRQLTFMAWLLVVILLTALFRLMFHNDYLGCRCGEGLCTATSYGGQSNMIF